MNMLNSNDIRYRAHCFKCKASIGDWALRIPFKQRLCWNCKKHNIKKIPYKTTARGLGRGLHALRTVRISIEVYTNNHSHRLEDMKANGYHKRSVWKKCEKCRREILAEKRTLCEWCQAKKLYEKAKEN